MELKIRLKTLRKQKNISQLTLGDAIGVSQQAVARWETGQATPGAESILRIASYFGVSADYLLCITDIPNIYAHQQPHPDGDITLLMTGKDPRPEDQARAVELATAAWKSEGAGDSSTAAIPQDAAALADFVRKIVKQTLAESKDKQTE